ncbi:SPOR domain-containing protein [Thalassospiraceae bacterium LMO-SO8]|nr:SPOR domain-containing protein [Alphaproteobacteria bacterium LMO-S08]WND76037.1 SPOR domain-containing protein [Thalassospiraceae bacterium LMO-SO8]
MRKSVIVVGACALLGGCALPVPIQVASWAIDILSVVTTEKSITDHGLSALTSKDCALYRAVTEDDNVVCRDIDDRKDVMTADAGKDATALADKDIPPLAPGFDTIEAQVAKADTVPVLDQAAAMSSDTAVQPAPGNEQPVAVNIDLAALQPMTEKTDRPFVRFTRPNVDVVQVPATALQTAAALPSAAVENGKPKEGFYYVIGSFRGSERAKRHMQAFRSLVPAVLHGKIGRDGRDVYRVVVGPFDAQERTGAFRRIKRAGIADTWAIRVSPKDWSVAAKLRPTEQADASAVLSARDWPGLVHFTVQH